MKRSISVSAAIAMVPLMPAYAAPGDILFQDDFETGSISNYTVVSSDTFAFSSSLITYGFDYGTFGFAGISGTGLLLETTDSITAFINDLSVTTPISIKYDAIGSAVAGGSTEYLTTGVYDDQQLAFSFSASGSFPAAPSDGVYIAASTDSDFAGAGDFAVFESFDGASPSSLSFMNAADVADSGTAFATILPEIPGVSPAGVMEGRVVEVEVRVDGNRIQWFLDGFLLTDVLASKVAAGGVGIGIIDPFPSTNNGGGVGSGTGTAWAIDNLVITEIAPIPEPTTAVALLMGVAGLGLRRRRA